MGVYGIKKKFDFLGDIALYGAGMVAVSVYYAVKTLYADCKVIAFLVSDRANNPPEIDGIPVLALDEFDRTDLKIVVATPENYHAAITTVLKEKGMNDYICIDSQTEASLMEQYYDKVGDFLSLHSLKAGNRKPAVSVYMSRFHKDQKLEHVHALQDWVHPIQAGAALTAERVASLCDNTGNNISEKNGNYSELTALYWIAQNASAEYLGLFHYRRVLDIGEKDLLRLKENDIDVLLPYPTIHFPNISEHHRRYLKEADWKAMMTALKELAPEYAAAVPKMFTGKYFYNYNMFLAKEEILKEYCNWLFPILQRTEELSVPAGCERADRYIGYLGENLTTLYFLYHQKDFKIAHTGRLMFT